MIGQDAQVTEPIPGGKEKYIIDDGIFFYFCAGLGCAGLLNGLIDSKQAVLVDG